MNFTFFSHAAAAVRMMVVTTSSVCSGNGDQSQPKRSNHHQLPDCSIFSLDKGQGWYCAAERKRLFRAWVHLVSEENLIAMDGNGKKFEIMAVRGI